VDRPNAGDDLLRIGGASGDSALARPLGGRTYWKIERQEPRRNRSSRRVSIRAWTARRRSSSRRFFS
jgi:hypothetical protein